MDDITTVGNLVEAGVWFFVSLILFGKAWVVTSALRNVLGVLAAGFLVFGVSDVIESQTGAWWRPVWLLLVKGGCISVFVLGFWQYYRLLSAKRAEDQDISL